MTNEEDNELEEFIGDWYWNDRSHRYARDLAKYLFGFIDGLYDLGLNRKTVLKHVDNCWAIGYLECTYGRAGRSNFDPARAFYSEEAGYEYEFRRKFSDSN